MAIGTLSNCYNNGKVFEGVVKMRRGETASIFLSCSCMSELHSWFFRFLAKLDHTVEKETPSCDPCREDMLAIVKHDLAQCAAGLMDGGLALPTIAPAATGRYTDYAVLVLAVTYFYCAWNMGSGSWVAGVAAAIGLAQVQRLIAAVLLLLALGNAINAPIHKATAPADA